MKYRNRRRAVSALCAETLLSITGATGRTERSPNFLGKYEETQRGQQINGLAMPGDPIYFCRPGHSELSPDYRFGAMALFFQQMAQKDGSSGRPEWPAPQPLSARRTKTTQRCADKYIQSGKLP